MDVITTGNHALRRREIYEYFDEGKNLVRPANFHREAPGVGYLTLDFLRYQLCVVNLQGVVYMEPLENPFDCIDRILKEVKTPNILVDFHAEATSEKLALAYYLDGRVTAVVGTHTHVQTADEKVCPRAPATSPIWGCAGPSTRCWGCVPTWPSSGCGPICRCGLKTRGRIASFMELC